MTAKEADKIKKEIQKASLGEWYVGRIDGKSEEVVLLDNVIAIIDKNSCLQSTSKDV